MRNRSDLAIGTIVIVIIAVVVVAAAVGAYFLLTPMKYGTSSISLSQSAYSVAQGKSVGVPYSVTLASGTKWGTNIVVTNASALSSSGITASDSAGMADPPYSGTLTISASSTTPVGTYHVVIQAMGDDPSSQTLTITLTVTQGTGSSSTTSTTTTSSTCVGYYC
jgi:hypothetical protein